MQKQVSVSEPKEPVVNVGEHTAGKAFCLCSHLAAEVFCKKWKHLQMSSLFLILIMKCCIHTFLFVRVCSNFSEVYEVHL